MRSVAASERLCSLSKWPLGWRRLSRAGVLPRALREAEPRRGGRRDVGPRRHPPPGLRAQALGPPCPPEHVTLLDGHAHGPVPSLETPTPAWPQLPTAQFRELAVTGVTDGLSQAPASFCPVAGESSSAPARVGRDGGRGGSERHSRRPGRVYPLHELQSTSRSTLLSDPTPETWLTGAGRLPQLCKSTPRAVLSLARAGRPPGEPGGVLAGTPLLAVGRWGRWMQQTLSPEASWGHGPVMPAGTTRGRDSGRCVRSGT